MSWRCSTFILMRPNAKRAAIRASVGKKTASQVSAFRSIQKFSIGKFSRTVNMDFPAISEEMDTATFQVLANTLVEFDRADILSDLFAHLRERLARSRPEDRAFEQRVLASLYWWNDEKEKALTELRAACEALPSNAELQMDLADLYAKLGQVSQAIVTLDRIKAIEPDFLQRKENDSFSISLRRKGTK